MLHPGESSAEERPPSQSSMLSANNRVSNDNNMVPNRSCNDMLTNNNLENPQIPTQDMTQMNFEEPPSSSSSSEQKLADESLYSSIPNGAKRNSVNKSKAYSKLSSWREIKPTEPDFNIGILIDDIKIIDRHVSAMSKPASRCFLTSVVVLNPPLDCENEMHVQEAVRNWLKLNKVDVDVEELVIGQGLDGYQEMLKQTDIDAVYIVLSPR
jgi:hypothetical protein